ncbi:unnamed protein product [Peniophora sp. CBMAI 1063]|nr:unnamed protein product [Peniophora sp. CBMAI 1063]
MLSLLLVLFGVASGSRADSNLSAYADFNSSTGGRLVFGTPFARACFENAGPGVREMYDAASCSGVQSDYTDEATRIDSLGAYINTQWETCQKTGEQCLLDATDPTNALAYSPPAVCSQGSVPPVGLEIASANDVVLAFNFARNRSLKVVVKNTGHDYKGRSSGPDTLALWTRGLQGISINEAFVPQGCPTSTTPVIGVTMGAGVTADVAVAFAEANNITIPTGADPTVGLVGGYTQGGGHSKTSNTMGLAVDRVIEFNVVTSSGEHLVANACQNADLFFALRGGGGGTFGVVLNLTTRALPATAVSAAVVEVTPTPSNVAALLDFMVNNSLQLAQDGWGGAFAPTQGLLSYANPLLNETAAKESVASLQALATSLGGIFIYEYLPTYGAYFSTFGIDPVPTAVPVAQSSRLVPSSLFETEDGRAKLLSALTEGFTALPSSAIFANTPFLAKDPGGTSVHSAWRDSLWHVVLSAGWSFNSSLAQREAVYQSLEDGIAPLRAITPDAAYTNEGDVYEPNWEETFWGSNYAELLSIKNKYDPDHLLDCWQCVGWLGQSDSRYKCYLPPPS